MMKTFFQICLLTTLCSVNALAQSKNCTSEPSQTLTLAYPATPNLKDPVKVKFSLEGNRLHADFEVRTPEINAKPKLDPGQYPYQFDVVELFVSVAGPDSTHLPYYEFELSPYNQTFQVKVNDPKKPFIEGIDMGMEHSAQKTATGWKAHMSIPLENLNWDGRPEQIIGNAYAILGKSPKRNFWSLSLPKQEKPNFHKPQFFKPLLQCK